jgi:hypothetical protein
MWPSAKDALRLLATVRFPVIQFNPVQQPFMTFGIVPIAVGGERQDRPFAAMVRGAKADLQFASSFSLTWLAPVQR